ncbi:C40 family peptidase [Spiractinospora alimapuensis]|uniref:C40 family peptidase n=1 Tax=Spiractinospora alimapuensis TaxID=2820884 RepID=UPI001F206AD0|nr:NlpC/P60 family protein [Spiractinospora alimapuensis]
MALFPIAVASPAAAEPSEDEVRERIEELQEEFSELNATYNTAVEDHEAAETRLSDLEEEIDELEDRVEGLRSSVRSVANAAYTGMDTGSPIYLIGTDDPEAVMDNSADLGYLSASRSEALEEYLDERDSLDALHEEAESTEEQAADDLEAAEEARDEGEARIEEQEELLAELTPEEQAEAVGNDGDSGGGDSGGSPPSYDGSASGDARAALDFAYAQIGKSYCWGGTGPNCYDCSGLTSGAWGAAGVSLPRTAAAQFGAGQRVSWDNLQPGDLMFFYNASAPSHVGLYAGDGKMVHAPNSSRPVVEDSVAGHYQSSFVGAVRP